MPSLKDVIKISKQNYEILLNGGAIQGYTYDPNALYLIEDNNSLLDHVTYDDQANIIHATNSHLHVESVLAEKIEDVNGDEGETGQILLNDTGYIYWRTPSWTHVEANPTETGSSTLTKIKINSTVFNLPSSGGGGDVTGPNESIGGGIAVFNGTTGKVIKQSANGAVTLSGTNADDSQITGLHKIESVSDFNILAPEINLKYSMEGGGVNLINNNNVSISLNPLLAAASNKDKFLHSNASTGALEWSSAPIPSNLAYTNTTNTWTAIQLMSASSNATSKAIKWGTVNNKTPYINYAQDQTDGTFLICSLTGTNYASGLAIGGGSGNLLWKGNRVATANEIPSLSGYATQSWVEGKGYSTFSGNYNDLSNKPTIPTVTSTITSGSTAAVTSGAVYTGLSNKCSFNTSDSSKVQNIRALTQAQYNALTPDANTLYFIIG